MIERPVLPVIILSVVTGCQFTDVSLGDQLPGETESGSEAGMGSETGSSVTDSGSMDSSESDSGVPVPEIPTLELSFSSIKQFHFSWVPAQDADYYQLFESGDVGDDFVQVGGDLVGESVSLTMPLHQRANASYKLLACNDIGCSESQIVNVVGTLAEAIGFFKASNSDAGDSFGCSVALSGDGNTLVVGARYEDSNSLGIGGNQANDSATDAGGVYIFERDAMNVWTQRAYVKASNSDPGDSFGYSVALSADGATLAVGAIYEDSNSPGVNGNQVDNSATDAGAVYVYKRDAMDIWTQHAYIKASNPDPVDAFGWSVALSEDGGILAVGALWEDSNAISIDGNQSDNSSPDAGAVYVYQRNDLNVWVQQAYVKASNADGGDLFGFGVTLSLDGSTLAVGACWEASNALGVGGNQADNTAPKAGAAYVYQRDGMNTWTQHAYVKASNSDASDYFGYSITLSGNGSTLAVGAYGEDSNAVGIAGNQADDSAMDAGAVYVYQRDGMGAWTQQAYVKPSNSDVEDIFGYSVGLSADGGTLTVGALYEDSSALGVGGNQTDNSADYAGAVFVYEWNGMDAWTQRAYVKASNSGALDIFGWSVALSGDGSTLAVGAPQEASNAMAGNQVDDSAPEAGAVYLY